MFDDYESPYDTLLMKANKPIMTLQRLVRSNDPKTGVSCMIKYIYFDSTKLSEADTGRCSSERLFL